MARHARRHTGRVFDGGRLFEARSRAFLSQVEVAAQVGVTARQYQRWEGNESEPQPRHVRALAEVFDCDPASFFVERDPNGEGVAA
jgi:transcriptional regulator with XRE-family HTH domain